MVQQVDPRAQRPQAQGADNFGDLARGAAWGGGIGLLIGRPFLGALAGVAYKLFTGKGMSEGMQQAIDQFGTQLNANGGVGDAVRGLGRSLFGEPQGDPSQLRADPDRAQANARSGMPGWAKLAAGGGLALLGINLFNNIFDRFTMNGFGNPLFGGAGMFPFGGGMPYADPYGMGFGMGVGPAPILGQGVSDIFSTLLTGGVVYGGYRLIKGMMNANRAAPATT
jgi:hypothetical protein